jgi:small subunit ribosomal protein S6
MSDYEAMFIAQPNLNEQQKKELFGQLGDAIVKNRGEIISSGVWSEKRRLSYPIKKFQEGIYYLITFKVGSGAVSQLSRAYRLNENIVRTLIVKR